MRPIPLLVRLTWLFFACSLGGLAVQAATGQVTEVGAILLVDGLTLVMAVLVTFVSGIVQSFSRRYMAGTEGATGFHGRLLLLTLAVLLLAATNHLALFAGCWILMGWLLADLVGFVRRWPQARAASRRVRAALVSGSAFLVLALVLLGRSTGEVTITGVLEGVGTLSTLEILTVTGLLLAVAMAQSALIPFHGWLLSSMTAPTPVSAFMHAGLVNAGGLLLARFAPVVAELPVGMLAIAGLGALSALLAQAWMLMQVDVKRQLGCSTVAQMGFMVMQCGLGFFAAAIAHLILHGFYKAYLFLGSGSGVELRVPTDMRPAPGASGSFLVSAITALAGGVLFAWLTGKSMGTPNTGLLLTLVVVLAVLHAARTTLRTSGLAMASRGLALPLLVLPAIVLYAGVYRGVAALTTDLPMAVSPEEPSILHAVIGFLFILAYVTMERGWHLGRPRLYALLMRQSQPPASTLLTRRRDYHVH